MPALVDLALWAGDLLAVVVDVDVVPGEALASAVLAGGVAAEWPGDGDLVFTTPQAGVDAGQDLAVVGGGRGGGHVRDHVGAVGSTGLGQVSGEPLPADDVSMACVAGRGVVGRDDRPGRGRQPGPSSFSAVRQRRCPAASRW